MDKQTAYRLIHEQGADPAKLGRRAHRITGAVQLGRTWWVRTKRHFWHPATSRERELIPILKDDVIFR